MLEKVVDMYDEVPHPSEHTSTGHKAPESPEAERSILGTLLTRENVADNIFSALTEDDFYRSAHARIFGAIKQLHAENKAIDFVILSSRLREQGFLESVGGLQYILELESSAGVAANFEHHCQIIKSDARKRQAIRVGSAMVVMAQSGEANLEQIVSKAQSDLSEIKQVTTKKMPRRLKEIFPETIKSMELRYYSGNEFSGLTSGFPDLDQMLGGFQKSDLIILAGRTSMGKTTLALNICEHVGLKERGCVLLFSLEMSAEQLSSRLLSSHGRINGKKIVSPKGNVTDNDWSRIAASAQALSDTEIWVDDERGLSPSNIRAKCKYVNNIVKIDMIIVDYLNNLGGKVAGENSEKSMARNTRELRELAGFYDVPLIALSQLNRSHAARSDKRPVLSDLRDSGAIEQDADVVMFIHREEADNPETDRKGLADLIVAKQRKGAVGTVELKYFPHHTRFESLAGDERRPSRYDQ